MTRRKEFIEFCERLAESHPHEPWNDLRRCKADYFTSGNWTILRSYWTIVAAFSHRTRTVYALKNCSVTTNQHVRKFCEEMDAIRLTKLYKDSTRNIETGLHPSICTFQLNAKDWRAVIERDYEGYIEDIHK